MAVWIAVVERLFKGNLQMSLNSVWHPCPKQHSVCTVNKTFSLQAGQSLTTEVTAAAAAGVPEVIVPVEGMVSEL
jgi:hypothetical protein